MDRHRYLSILTPELVAGVVPAAYELFMTERRGSIAIIPPVDRSDESRVESIIRAHGRPIIAFAGRMGSGKDHACDYFCERFGAIKLHIFESGLRRIGLFYGRAIDKSIDRSVLQAVGELGRRLRPQFWLQMTFEEDLLRILDRDRPVVITGVRYKTDVRYLATLGVRTFIIRRPGLVLAGTPEESDPSERDLDDYHECAELINRGTVGDFDALLAETARDISLSELVPVTDTGRECPRIFP
ncbi:ORF76 [Ictalurid herpesvirus 1]|uniref:Uncharacterized protein ORF76 n=1 Tax=Ictalurid herpesvirus 1 (strain Auburn) TaxID=766178 RepID=VG76_ICHVA|nr:ORF76 [Ictalurid herpesvirus 1]Q00150.1 RecName: Full=Uncharacterized protein ORF76 [Ictalurid herpesvirus 1 (strain Auburn)]AAA88178.1 ORF76 [Ictalurid herpesvirus 1]